MGAVNQVEHKVADHGGNRGSASPPESHRALMGFHSYTRAGLCPAIHCLDSRCSLMQQRPVSRLNSIDQFFRTYCRSGGITKASRSVCLCVCVCVCVCPDSHTGMELFGLKHKWLFHGRVPMPCPCLSGPQEGGEGLEGPLSLGFVHSRISDLGGELVRGRQKVGEFVKCMQTTP